MPRIKQSNEQSNISANLIRLVKSGVASPDSQRETAWRETYNFPAMSSCERFAWQFLPEIHRFDVLYYSL